MSSLGFGLGRRGGWDISLGSSRAAARAGRRRGRRAADDAPGDAVHAEALALASRSALKKDFRDERGTGGERLRRRAPLHGERRRGA